MKQASYDTVGLGLPAYPPAEHEIGRSDQAQSGPQVVELERLLHIEEDETGKHTHGDHLLHDLELPQIEIPEADPVCRNLQNILKKSNAPTDEYDYEDGLSTHALQMTVPCKGHEEIGQNEQNNGFDHLLYYLMNNKGGPSRPYHKEA